MTRWFVSLCLQRVLLPVALVAVFGFDDISLKIKVSNKTRGAKDLRLETKGLKKMIENYLADPRRENKMKNFHKPRVYFHSAVRSIDNFSSLNNRTNSTIKISNIVKALNNYKPNKHLKESLKRVLPYEFYKKLMAPSTTSDTNRPKKKHHESYLKSVHILHSNPCKYTEDEEDKNYVSWSLKKLGIDNNFNIDKILNLSKNVHNAFEPIEKRIKHRESLTLEESQLLAAESVVNHFQNEFNISKEELEKLSTGNQKALDFLHMLDIRNNILVNLKETPSQTEKSFDKYELAKLTRLLLDLERKNTEYDQTMKLHKPNDV